MDRASEPNFPSFWLKLGKINTIFRSSDWEFFFQIWEEKDSFWDWEYSQKQGWQVFAKGSKTRGKNRQKLKSQPCPKSTVCTCMHNMVNINLIVFMHVTILFFKHISTCRFIVEVMKHIRFRFGFLNIQLLVEITDLLSKLPFVVMRHSTVE